MGRPSRRITRSVQRVYSQTMGLNSSSTCAIGPTTAMATRSGSAMPRRLGTRSANTTNTEVTAATDATSDRLAAVRSGSHGRSASAR